jgi:putative pre-16S rRNA nuclease
MTSRLLPQKFCRKKFTLIVLASLESESLPPSGTRPGHHHTVGLWERARQSNASARLTGFMCDFYTPPTLQRITLSKKEDNREPPEKPACAPGRRLLSLDLGSKRVGVAVSDELWVAVRPLPPLPRTSWKKLLHAVSEIARSFDAQALVLGLPLLLDGSEGEAAREARRLARNFQLSLLIPVFMQDERLTSREAESRLLEEGRARENLRDEVDSRAAAIILEDFISSRMA